MIARADDSRLIRHALTADACMLAAIDRLSSVSPWSEQQFLQVCESVDVLKNRVLVAQAGQQLQGFAVIYQVLDEASLHNIAVLPTVRRQGVGGALLQHCIDEVFDRAATLLLEVRLSNLAAIALYRRFGFKDDGIRPDYYPAAQGREDALLMSLQF
ncbi:MAG: ribosomal protein S18-alanine N-acetyltransferase [Parahaliea sp.]